MTPSLRCCATDGDIVARRADVTADGEIRAKRIEAAEPKAGHRLPPMRASHTPATAVDCYEVLQYIVQAYQSLSARSSSCRARCTQERLPAWLRRMYYIRVLRV